MLQMEYGFGNVHTLPRRPAETSNGTSEILQDILLRDSQSADEFVLCLQWVLFAKRPLKCEELYFGIMAGLKPEAVAAWNREEITKQEMEKFILNCSKGLVKLTGSGHPTFQFVNDSVRDFLRAQKLEGFSGTNSLAQGHELLKQCCHAYLRVDITTQLLAPRLPAGRSIEAAAEFRRLARKKFPLLEYAVRNVFHHADAAVEEGFSQEAFLRAFALRDWIRLDNLFERLRTSRHTPDASLLYIFAEKDLSNLVRVELQRVRHMDIKGESYDFPLCVALACNSTKAIRALLAPSALISSNENATSDSLSSSVLETLLDFHRDINHHNHIPQTPLSYAASKGDEATVKSLLRTRKVDLDSRDRKGQTPLSNAVEAQDEGIVKLLLESGGVDVNSKNISNQTPLLVAAARGDTGIVKLLLDTGQVDIELSNAYCQTPLSLSAERGHDAVAQLLLENSNVDVNTRDVYDQTPLLLAAEKGHERVVKLLLQTGKVDVHSTNTYGQTPLSCARKNKHWGTAGLLNSYKCGD